MTKSGDPEIRATTIPARLEGVLPHEVDRELVLRIVDTSPVRPRARHMLRWDDDLGRSLADIFAVLRPG